MTMKKLTIFAAVYAAMHAAHAVGDHWVQTGHQAAHKGDSGALGVVACARHVGTYTATTTGAVVALRALGTPIPVRALVAGQAVSAATHFMMDRRPWGRAIMRAARKSEFAEFGETSPGKAEHLGTGAYALDQSWHLGWIAVAAFVTAALA